jgi:hypothetical protein
MLWRACGPGLKIACIRADRGFYQNALPLLLEQIKIPPTAVARVTSSIRPCRTGLVEGTALD